MQRRAGVDGQEADVVEDSTEDNGPAFEASLSGDLDLVRRDELEALVTAFDSSGSSVAVIDLRDVPFVDSIGIKVMLDLVEVAQRRSGEVVLVEPQRQVLRVLQITGVRRMVRVEHEPESDAV
jgi:anti-anti-sigma factor